MNLKKKVKNINMRIYWNCCISIFKYKNNSKYNNNNIFLDSKKMVISKITIVIVTMNKINPVNNTYLDMNNNVDHNY